MSEHKVPFVPYANEADVIEVGGLTIENRLDRVTLAGDVDLTRDKAGLDKARLLHQLLGEVVAVLETAQLPDALPDPAITTVANPFD
jgi:hypothetical protein